MTEPDEGAEPTFGQAIEELEAILRRIEGEEVDVDGLAEELRRAAELLELARGKLRRAEVEVTQIVQGLSDEAPAAEGPGEGPGRDAEYEDKDEDEEDDDIPF